MSTKKKLTRADFEWAAKTLGCDIAAILAVDAIESRGMGFLPGTTEPVILFERHQFHRLTNGKFSTPANVNISNRVSGGYKGGKAEHVRLQQATALDREAGLKAASWGRFQIMGFNHEVAGHETLQDFINSMYDSERAQLEAFVAYIKNTGLVRFMNARDWAGFARRYNGPGYAKNKYDVKLRDAYNKFRAEESAKKANQDAKD